MRTSSSSATIIVEVRLMPWPTSIRGTSKSTRLSSVIVIL